MQPQFSGMLTTKFRLLCGRVKRNMSVIRCLSTCQRQLSWPYAMNISKKEKCFSAVIFYSRATTRAKQIAIGIKKFNADAKKVWLSVFWRWFLWFYLYAYLLQGMKYLMEINHVQNNPRDVAEFLFKGENLNKTAIGDYLGDRYICLSISFVEYGGK